MDCLSSKGFRREILTGSEDFMVLTVNRQSFNENDQNFSKRMNKKKQQKSTVNANTVVSTTRGLVSFNCGMLTS